MLKDVMMFVSICLNIMTCLIVWISGLLLGFSIIVCLQKVWKLLSWWLDNFHFLKIWKFWKFGNLGNSVFWKFGKFHFLKIWKFWKFGNFGFLKIWKFGNFGFLKIWKFENSENLENYIYLKYEKLLLRSDYLCVNYILW